MCLLYMGAANGIVKGTVTHFFKTSLKKLIPELKTLRIVDIELIFNFKINLIFSLYPGNCV